MNFICTILLSCIAFSAQAITYTFQSTGSYSDESNWDVYPGETVDIGDTILIEAFSIYNVNLIMWGGHLLINDNVNSISIDNLETYELATIEIQSSNLDLDIYGSIIYHSNSEIVSNCFIFINISNFGNGFQGIDGALSFVCGEVFYFNEGQENASILGMNDIYVENSGTLNALPGDIYVNCVLELFSGTIKGYDPFQLIQMNGEIKQTCANCTAYITNASEVRIKEGLIKGTVIID